MKLICLKTCKELSKSAFHLLYYRSYNICKSPWGQREKRWTIDHGLKRGGGGSAWSPGAPELLAVPPWAQSLLNNDSD